MKLVMPGKVPIVTASSQKSVFEKLLFTLWLASLIGFTVLLILPFRFTLLRAALIITGTLVWLLGVYLCHRWRMVWIPAVALPVVGILFLLLPGKPVDGEKLRNEYVSSLRSLKGTVYIWGGETRVGIDCSGLVRGALIDANLREGIRTTNPALLRTAASLWWHDCSAKALGENYRGLTVSLAHARSLNETDYSGLRQGDIAVMETGVHTLAYLGNKTWIQADPLPMRVVQTTVPSKEGWFIQGVQLLRWTEFGTTEPVASEKP